ncbi:N-acetylglucosamine-induced protein 1 [Madurella fahalii]|uniref:N-acetylglucosamine-induced protein 1 n=1 Tax=Madurella fahalii TaxID=1157608 RepID=A0ABQ0GQU9_9PEZI
MGENAIEEPPFPLTEVDKWVLSQTDDEYAYHTWDDLRSIIQNNELHVLKRKPSDLRRYMKWTAETKAEYGSITNFLLAHRLPKAWGSPPFTPASETPFADPSDYRVLINDWPYGFTPGITHLVVWSRTLIPTDGEVGDMTPETREIVAQFVKRYFVDSLGPGGEDKVLWFKNWVALQSVRTVDHIHVMVRDVDPAVLQEWAEEREWHRPQ